MRGRRETRGKEKLDPSPPEGKSMVQARGDRAARHPAPIHLKHKDLESLIGVFGEQVNRVLSEFQPRGHLSIDREYRIAPRDYQALASCCGPGHGLHPQLPIWRDARVCGLENMKKISEV